MLWGFAWHNSSTVTRTWNLSLHLLGIVHLEKTPIMKEVEKKKSHVNNKSI